MKGGWLALVLISGICAALLGAGCGRSTSKEVRNPTASMATAASTPTAGPEDGTPSPSPTQSPEQVVLAAYGRYWEAYRQALLELDVRLVEGVATGERLQQIREEIEGLRARGLAARVNVIHNPMVVEVSGDAATITDELVNNSFTVDAQTKQPPQASGGGDRFQDTYHLRHIDGTWKVVSSTRLVSR